MIKQEHILENEMHKILWDFVKKTDYLIPHRRSDLKEKKKELALLRVLLFRENMEWK